MAWIEFIEISTIIIRLIAVVTLYFFLGFGPGFIIGVLLANAITGRGKPLLMDVHAETVKRAGAHNSQWHPDDERWK